MMDCRQLVAAGLYSTLAIFGTISTAITLLLINEGNALAIPQPVCWTCQQKCVGANKVLAQQLVASSCKIRAIPNGFVCEQDANQPACFGVISDIWLNGFCSTDTHAVPCAVLPPVNKAVRRYLASCGPITACVCQLVPRDPRRKFVVPVTDCM